jgi:hypothetical protein
VWPSVLVTSYYGSIYPAVQNLLLAARAAGLGAALVTLPLWSPWRVRRALGLPWRVTPCAVVPLGWPLGRYGPTTRRPVGTVVHLDRYGHQPFKTRQPPDGARGWETSACRAFRHPQHSLPSCYGKIAARHWGPGA